jgi:putative copper resistance protein D
VPLQVAEVGDMVNEDRSRAVSALTHPASATVLYCAVVAGTHTPPFMDLVLRNEGVHDTEHALYLAAGYLFFLPVLGTEPLRHRASAIGAFLMLLITMLADSATGVTYTFQSREVFAPYLAVTRTWGPSLAADLHLGGYVMFIGSDVIMTVIAVALASRFFRSDADIRLPCGPRGSDGTETDARLGVYNEYLRDLGGYADA